MVPDDYFYCKKLSTKWKVRHCVDRQHAVFPPSRKTNVYPECKNCEQGKWNESQVSAYVPKVWSPYRHPKEYRAERSARDRWIRSTLQEVKMSAAKQLSTAEVLINPEYVEMPLESVVLVEKTKCKIEGCNKALRKTSHDGLCYRHDRKRRRKDIKRIARGSSVLPVLNESKSKPIDRRAVVIERIAYRVSEAETLTGDEIGVAGEVVGLLYRNGVPHERVTDALRVGRIVGELVRIARAPYKADFGIVAEYAVQGAVAHGI